MEMVRESRVQQEKDSSYLHLSLGLKFHPFFNSPLPEKLPRQAIKTLRQPFWKREEEKSSTLSPSFFLHLSAEVVCMQKDLFSKSKNNLLHTLFQQNSNLYNSPNFVHAYTFYSNF